MKLELEEYRTEATHLQNQQATIRRLEERNRQLEQQMEEKVKEIVEIRQRSLAEENQKTLEVLKKREHLLQEQLRQAKESVTNMQKIHEFAQSQLFELRVQSEEERAAKQAELDLLTDEVERAHARLQSIEREKGVLRSQLQSVNEERVSKQSDSLVSSNAPKSSLHAKEKDATLMEINKELQERPTSKVVEDLRKQIKIFQAETVIKERNMLEGFAIVESYCQLLKKPAFLDHKQKECPEELREAAAGLAYAALRCGDLPELRKIRRIFRSRFGREFTTAVTKLRDNCGVGADLLGKFSTKQPNLETKLDIMREIAIKKDIEVDLAEIPVETVENPNLQRRTRQARATMGRLCAACLREPPGGEMYEDAGSTAQAASESAAVARTDVD